MSRYVQYVVFQCSYWMQTVKLCQDTNRLEWCKYKVQKVRNLEMKRNTKQVKFRSLLTWKFEQPYA
jgi:hypothetical protein